MRRDFGVDGLLACAGEMGRVLDFGGKRLDPLIGLLLPYDVAEGASKFFAVSSTYSMLIRATWEAQVSMSLTTSP